MDKQARALMTTRPMFGPSPGSQDQTFRPPLGDLLDKGSGGFTVIKMTKENQTQKYEGTPFSISYSHRTVRAGAWDVVDVKILHNGTVIGEYVRGYPAHAAKTFQPFRHNGVWYALYSAKYTELQVARLENAAGEPAFEPWCGDSGGTPPGFCPTEVYVPQQKRLLYSFKEGDGEYWNEIWDNQAEYNDPVEDEGKFPKEIETKFAPFGFVCGCYWGDDSLWKIRHIDLSEVENKVMKITERWGYCPLPPKPLRECVFLEDCDSDGDYIGVSMLVFKKQS